MAQHPQIPTFGNWESEGDVPYTVYFENTRKSKTGNKMNPKNQQEDSEAESKGQKRLDAPRPNLEHRTDKDDTTLNISTGSPYHRHGVKSQNEKVESEQKGQVALRPTAKKTFRQSMGSDHSNEHSPLHPNSHVRAGVKGIGVSSPSWERKGSSEGGRGVAPFTPGRSRLRSITKGDDTHDHGPAVPKFGDWDETDPASAEEYTQVFDKVREEKQSAAEKVPGMPTEPSFSNSENRYGNDNTKGCWCFSWIRSKGDKAPN